VAFPSAARGGLHSSELWSARADKKDALDLQAFSVGLLRILASEDVQLAVETVAVDLTEAHGSEPLFGDALNEWLVQDVGVHLKLCNSSDATAWLVERGAKFNIGHGAASAIGNRRLNGATLLLPPNAIPSLQALFAGKREKVGGSGSGFILADRITRYPMVEWQLPNHQELPTPGNPLPLLQDGDAPVGTSLAGLTLAICLTSREDSDARALFPISREVAQPIALPGVRDELTGARSVSVIVTGRADQAALSALSQALSTQVGEYDLELIVAGESTDAAEEKRVDSSGDFPVLRPKLSGSGWWERIGAAADIAKGCKLLFADCSLVLHDPRTVDALWSVSERGNVGSVGCAIVQESVRSKGKPIFSTRAGYVVDAIGLGVDVRVFEPNFAHSLFPPCIPVVANPGHCLLIDRDVWGSLADVRRQCVSDEGWLRLGIELIRRGLQNLCLTQVTASLERAESGELEVAAEEIADILPHVAAFRAF
jgi:hypothetical protein